MSWEKRARPSRRRVLREAAPPVAGHPAAVGVVTAAELAAVATAMDDRLTEQWLLSGLLAGEESPEAVIRRVERLETVHDELAALHRRLWGLVATAAAP